MLHETNHTARPRRCCGSAVVEFALATPLLLILLAGVLDYGLALVKGMAVANAARVGALYGSSSPSQTTNSSGIQTAALNSAPAFTGFTVTSAQSCQCPAGTSVSCSGSCSSGMLIYVQVTVTATSSAIFACPGLGYSGTLKTQATMRAQ